MNKELIPHVFASVQSLERYLTNIHNMLTDNETEKREIRAALPQMEKMVRQMRRVANKLQLEVAAEDTNAVNRSLQIFYGLNHMIRPEILAAFLKLTNGSQQIEDAAHFVNPLTATPVH
jgi:hypothetical protein